MYVSASGMESDLEDMAALETSEIALAINSLNRNKHLSVVTWDKVYKSTQEDGTMVKLTEPYHSSLPTRI